MDCKYCAEKRAAEHRAQFWRDAAVALMFVLTFENVFILTLVMLTKG